MARSCAATGQRIQASRRKLRIYWCLAKGPAGVHLGRQVRSDHEEVERPAGVALDLEYVAQRVVGVRRIGRYADDL